MTSHGYNIARSQLNLSFQAGLIDPSHEVHPLLPL